MCMDTRQRTAASPPLDRPDVRSNQFKVHTGAVYGGYLSAAIFNDTQAEPLHTSSMPLCLPYTP